MQSEINMENNQTSSPKMKIDFKEVLNLASTKWNFIKYKPGLVGGHCLPVDPYYFSYIAKKNKINTDRWVHLHLRPD